MTAIKGDTVDRIGCVCIHRKIYNILNIITDIKSFCITTPVLKTR